MSPSDKLHRVLDKHNLTATPSAINILQGCLLRIPPDDLISGVKREHPDIKEINTELAVKILTTWHEYIGIEAKSLIEELRRATSQKNLSRSTVSQFRTLHALQVCQDQWVTATQVAKITGRKRATESTNLNKLKRMRRIRKKKEGRRAYFRIKNGD